MLVYDVNDSVFYYWKATVWIPIPGVNTDNQNIDSVRLNPLDSVLTVIPTIQEAKDFLLFDELEKEL